MSDYPTIQNVPPSSVLHCNSAEEMGKLTYVQANKGAVIACYGRYYEWYGSPPVPDHVQIEAPQGIVAHYVPDMTLKVNAGTPLADIQQVLGKEKQWLPIDGLPMNASIGEIVAHDAHGLLTNGFGKIRDMMLGLSYVDSKGDLITVGGRTVKNVAGYDVSRFMIGNANTLGLLSEVTLRTWAAPEVWIRLEVTGVDDNFIHSHGTALSCSDANPAGTRILKSANQPPTYMFYYEGAALRCEIQSKALENFLVERGIPSENISKHQMSHQQMLNHLDENGKSIWGSKVILKLIVPPALTTEVIVKLDESNTKFDNLVSYPQTGNIWLLCDWNSSEAMQVQSWLTNHFKETGMIGIWIKRPEDGEDMDTIWPVPNDWEMVKKLKNTMDPTQIFNPGRLW